MDREVIVIGGGVAGMYAALTLEQAGVRALVLEQQPFLGGKLNRWDRLFPTMVPAEQVLGEVRERLLSSSVKVRTNARVVSVGEQGCSVELEGGEILACDGVIIATGFELFNAMRKEEYGYGIYDNVITSADLEDMLRREGRVVKTDGTTPSKVAFLHCVGSRDQKVNQSHCSKVCCITGVKQAIELKQALPLCEVYNFYMDMRMFGPGYEEMYRTAQQEYNIHFIRGRISEASATIDGRVQIKAEDTLVGLPLRMEVDMLVLLIGMCGGRDNGAFAVNRDITLSQNGFLAPANLFGGSVCSACPRICYAGAVTAPKTIGESINEGVAAAHRMVDTLQCQE